MILHKYPSIYLHATLVCLFLVSIQQQLGIDASISLSLGYSHSCALFDNHQMKCWGQGTGLGRQTNDNIGDSLDELGNNLPYFDVGNDLKIKKVKNGGLHTCVILLNSNEIKCFGFNYYGQIGIGLSINVIGEVSGHVGDFLPVVDLGKNVKATDISLGYYHTCVVVLNRNKVKCFGFGLYGQLGYESPASKGRDASSMGENLKEVNLGNDYEVSSIYSSSSASHTCAIFSKPETYNKRIKCWGSGYYYQLGYGSRIDKGNGDNEMGNHLPFIDLGLESRVYQVVVGGSHTCVLLIDSSLKCFGMGDYGQLGNGSDKTIKSAGKNVPFVDIDDFETISSMSAGYHFTCIIYGSSNVLKCFGRNNFGQLGQGDTHNRGNTKPSIIPYIPAIDLGSKHVKIVSIESGGVFNCVVFSDSSVKCFGDGAYGQLGIGSNIAYGDKAGEMGDNLPEAYLFSTKSPTNPTEHPTLKPSNFPTEKPTPKPTWYPTWKPTYKPTLTTFRPSTEAPTDENSVFGDFF